MTDAVECSTLASTWVREWSNFNQMQFKYYGLLIFKRAIEFIESTLKTSIENRNVPRTDDKSKN